MAAVAQNKPDSTIKFEMHGSTLFTTLLGKMAILMLEDVNTFTYVKQLVAYIACISVNNQPVVSPSSVQVLHNETDNRR